jgi:hypothetical protein
MIDQTLHHDATLMKINVLDAQHFTMVSWHCVTHMTIANCLQKCGFNLNQTNDGEDATEFTTARDDWVQLKAGVTFQECVACDNDVLCEVQTLEQMMDEKCKSDMSEE